MPIACTFNSDSDPDYQVYYWIGWKPDPTQPKALKPQKSDVSRHFAKCLYFLVFR